MASLNNYLKGNLLLQKGFHNASVETSIENLKVCQKLFQYSLQENIQAKDRNILIINFDIGKHKRFLYNSLGGPEVKFENKKIVKVQPKVFVIEYDFDFDSAIKEDINSINSLVAEFNSEVLKKHPQPLFLFIQGLEILELYLNPTDIYYWLLNILNDYACLKQAYFFVQRDILSVKMMEFLETIVNCRVLVETHQQADDTLKGIVQMVLFKNSGFSYIENYQVSLKGDQKIICKIEKITQEVIEAQKNEEKDLQKFFKTPFKLEVTDAEKKLKEKVELPHMKAQNPETVWKDFLLENENEDLDPEQDEDEDLDV